MLIPSEGVELDLKTQHNARLVLWIIFGACLLAVLSGILLVVFAPLDLEKLEQLSQSSAVYDKDSQLVAVIAGKERRTNVPLISVPRDVQNAFLAAEDARFYDHFGIDPYRMGGALLANMKSGGFSQGASTITQQLVKLTHLTADKTIVRKLTEIFMALKLERTLNKDQILERYLNTVYFGAGAYGVQSAAQVYFGVDADQLTLEQGALLAAVIKSPSTYAPHLNTEKAKQRRDLVLGEMQEYQFITAEEAAAAKALPIQIKQIIQADTNHPWAVDLATEEAAMSLNISIDELISGGYKVYTTIDQGVQTQAEALFQDGKHFPSDAKDGTKVQAALVALNSADGSVLAVVGGRDYEVRRGLNRATGMKRQPGSAFKPVSVYAAAIDQYGYLPVNMIEDVERDFGGGYTPRNVGGVYNGTVTLRASLARSLNAASVDLMTKVGIPAARKYAEAAGIPLTGKDNNLSLALGSLTEGVSPILLGAAYAPLANGGQSVVPHTVAQIVDRDGQLVYQHRAHKKRVMSDQSAYMLTNMLLSAVDWGSAQKLKGIPGDVAAKTGTVGLSSGGNRDIWTVAYSPRTSVTVWMGFDQPDKDHALPDSASGSNQPAALCAKLLSASGNALVQGRFQRPQGLTEVLIDARALELTHRPMLATSSTPKSMTMTEVFKLGQEPTEPSTAWVPPMRVFDLSGELTSPTSAQLKFTCVQQDAIYRVYRADGEPVVIAELIGEAGQQLVVNDDQAYEGAAYFVIPVHKELLTEGITLEGKPSETVVPKRPFGFRDWIALPTPQATVAPVEVPEEAALFVEEEEAG